MFGQDVGEGVIDNIIIQSSVHRWWGALSVAAMLVVVVAVTLDVYRASPVSPKSRLAIFATQIILGIQLLLGIKMLDQGQGILQLYIHYVGGLLPLGIFLAAGWLARGDTVKSARVLLFLLSVGLGSAIMAFTIGSAYVNQ